MKTYDIYGRLLLLERKTRKSSGGWPLSYPLRFPDENEWRLPPPSAITDGKCNKYGKWGRPSICIKAWRMRSFQFELVCPGISFNKWLSLTIELLEGNFLCWIVEFIIIISQKLISLFFTGSKYVTVVQLNKNRQKSKQTNKTLQNTKNHKTLKIKLF